MRKPSKFIAFQERRLHRPLTHEELTAIAAARAKFSYSRRDMVKAMWAVLAEFEESRPSTIKTYKAF